MLALSPSLSLSLSLSPSRLHSGDGQAHLLAQSVQGVDSAGLRVGHHFGMEFRALVADLAHVAQHQQTRPWQTGQHINGSAHRVRVGVVAVVHQREGVAIQLDHQGL